MVQSIKDNITQEEVVEFVRAPPAAPGPAPPPAPAPAQGGLADAPADPVQPDAADGAASVPAGSHDATPNAAAADNAAGNSEVPSRWSMRQ